MDSPFVIFGQASEVRFLVVLADISVPSDERFQGRIFLFKFCDVFKELRDVLPLLGFPGGAEVQPAHLFVLPPELFLLLEVERAALFSPLAVPKLLFLPDPVERLFRPVLQRFEIRRVVILPFVLFVPVFVFFRTFQRVPEEGLTRIV
jgi:hypothetical protein